MISRIAGASFLILSLTACAAAPYQTTEITDRFSDPAGPAVHAMTGNAVDFAGPLGIVRTTQLNGLVIRDRTSGKVIKAGFIFSRVVSTADRNLGAPRWLGIRAGDPLVFLTGSERVSFTASEPSRIDHETSRGVGYSITTDYFEDAGFLGTPDDFRKIAYAGTLEFQVSGRNGSESWPRPNRRLLEAFQANLQRFYESEIAPYR